MAGVSAQGIVLKMGNTVIGEVTAFSGPDGEATVMDATTLASVAKEKVMGLPDEGKFTFDINYDPSEASHAALATARSSRAVQHFEVDFGTAEPMEFDAFVTGFSIDGGVDAILTGSVSTEITGAVTWPSAV